MVNVVPKTHRVAHLQGCHPDSVLVEEERGISLQHDWNERMISLLHEDVEWVIASAVHQLQYLVSAVVQDEVQHVRQLETAVVVVLAKVAM